MDLQNKDFPKTDAQVTGKERNDLIFNYLNEKHRHYLQCQKKGGGRFYEVIIRKHVSIIITHARF